jgi:hypothetical protein
MKKFYLLLIFISINSFSQNFLWADFPSISYSANPSNIGYSITCDSFGNIYEIGFKDNYFYSGEAYGNLYYRKYNTNGQLLFDKTIGGKVRSFNLVSDSDGNIFVAASFKSLITYDTIQISTGTTETGILLKFDPNGNFLYNQIITNLGTAAKNFSALDVDSSNNVYLGFDDFFNSKIVKLSPTGTLLMTIEQQNVPIISSVSIDNLGNIYAAGSCAKSNSVFAGVSQPTALDYSVYAVKYSDSGISMD